MNLARTVTCTALLLLATLAPAAAAAAPTANAGPDLTVQVNEAVRFDGSGSASGSGDAIRSYLWDFKDGATGTGVRPTHTFTRAGVYDVMLTVLSDTGDTHSDTARVTVQSDTLPPAITAPTGDTTAVAGQVKTITATVTDNSGSVATVTLRYKLATETQYRSVTMNLVDGAYSGSIPGSAVTGTLHYHVTATDAANNVARSPSATASPSDHTITVADSASPTISGVNVPSAVVHGSALAVTATISDPGGLAAATLHYRRDAADAWKTASFPTTGGTVAASVPWSFLAAGTSFQYYVTATDVAGNPTTSQPAAGGTSPASANPVVAPGITHAPLADRTVTRGTGVSVSATVADDGTVASVQAFVRKGATGDFTEVTLRAGADGTWTGAMPAAVFSDGGSGTYQYHVEARDDAGLVTRSPATGEHAFVVTLETPATFTPPPGPAVTVTAPAEGSVVGGTVTVTGTATADAATRVTSVTVWTGGRLHDANGTGDWSFAWDTTGLADGEHALSVRVETAEGGRTLRPLKVVVDNTPPVVTLAGPNGTAHPAGTADVRVTATDAHAVNVTLLLDGEPLAVEKDGAAFVARDVRFRPGDRTVTARVVDAAGNDVESVLHATVVPSLAADEAPPALAVTDAPADGARVRAGTSLVLTVTDDQGVDATGVRVTINGEDVTDRTTFTAGVLTVPVTRTGDVSVVVRAEDVVGRESTLTLAFHADGDGPAIVIGPATGTTFTVGDSLVLTVTLSDDAGVDAAATRVLLDGEDVTADAVVANGVLTYTTTVPEDAAGETWRVEVEGADALGNAARADASFDVAAEDADAPDGDGKPARTTGGKKGIPGPAALAVLAGLAAAALAGRPRR